MKGGGLVWKQTSVPTLAPGGGGARPGVDGQRARQLPADAGHGQPVDRPQARASLLFTTMQHSQHSASLAAVCTSPSTGLSM